MCVETNRARLGKLILLVAFLVQSGSLLAQDLEPRRWSHLPVGLNVMSLTLADSTGDIEFDPVLRIEDATYDLSIAALSYIRAFDLFGKTARLDFVAPWTKGRWEGLVDGVDTAVRRQGMADPWMRFSVNLYGAPALQGREYLQYLSERPSNTTIGAGLTVIAPLGEYNMERLINLGNNRWVFRPQLGVLHQREKWQFELTGSVFLYQTNSEFWRGSVREQDPLWFLQSHVIYTVSQRTWASLSYGFAYGGRSTVNGQSKDDASRSALMAVSMGYNINRSQGLKFTYLRTRTHTSQGNDSDTLSLGWSFRWSD